LPPLQPPAGGRSPQPAALRIGDAVGYGWGAYWKNVGPLLLIAVVVLAINAVFSGLSSAVGDNTVARVLIQLAGTLVSLLVTLGWMRVALEITRGVRPQVGDLFHAVGYGTFILASILFYIGAIIGFILLVIPGIIFVVVFGFYGFVIAERGEGVGVLESLQRSAEITRGHRWQLFGLGLLLLLINIVGLILCFVGLLFTWGITLLAWAYAYRTLSGERVDYATWGL
jgi:uncharacterized membrane protein